MSTSKYILILMIAGVSFSSCLREVFCEEGEGDLLTEIIEIDDFTGIDLQENADIRITQGPIQVVTVTARENIMDRLKTEVDGGIWDINLGRDCYQNLHLDIEIVMPFIDEIHLSGAGLIEVGSFTGLENVDMSISGSGDIQVGAFQGTEDVDVSITGSGEILAREAFPDLKKLDIDLTASGTFDGFEMAADDVDVRIAGRGNIFVTAREALNVRITGSGNLHYKGNPLIDANITGSGKIIDEN